MRYRKQLLAAVIAAGLLFACGKKYVEEETSRDFTIQAGTELYVTPTDDFKPNEGQPGDLFAGVLSRPLMTEEARLVAPAGSPVVGELVEVPVEPGAPSPDEGETTDSESDSAEPALGVELTSFTLSGGATVEISTAPVVQAKVAEDPDAAPTLPDEREIRFVMDESAEAVLSLGSE